MFIILIIVLLLLIIGGILIKVFNRFVNNRNIVKDAWSNIDVALKRRHDLIPNLVRTVKGYASHEQKTIKKARYF